MLASGHGQETNQFTEDDVEFSDLGRRGIYAAAVYVLGAFCMEDFLGEIEDRASRDGLEERSAKRSGCARWTAGGGCPYMNCPKKRPHFWGRDSKRRNGRRVRKGDGSSHPAGNGTSGNVQTKR